MGTRRAARQRSERGATVVEFALLMPVLFLLLFGIIQYGLYFWAMQGGSDIARNAARMAAVGDPATCAAYRTAVAADIQGLTGSGSTATVRRSYATALPSQVQVGDVVTVTVQFDSFDLQLPILPFVDDGEVNATAEARVEFVPRQPEACP
ncbi:MULTISPECIES: TadE/TadG family type IV pilus assembly protein [Nocardioides]|uniref:TadE/TadG family type IV pilus assembly protein n=1 Tax=Nocardioides kribbensis TaxID=305517 RepID=A0ABV1P1E6_9ACTN|nr:MULTISPECIES: TadE/TadG family type IV pilus assembly protein [Nocardioides]MCM3514201.1 pilus assembly protein [Nocardioides sp. P86]